MTQDIRWRSLLIVVVLGLSIWAITPLSKIALGLDLKGGVHLVMRVKTGEAIRLETTTTMEQLREELDRAGIMGPTLTVVNDTTFRVDAVPPAQDAAFRQTANAVQTNFNRGSGVSGSYTFTMKPNIVVQLQEETVDQAIQTIERRVNELGVAEPVIAPAGTTNDQIMVELPGVSEIDRAKEIIRSTALLELKLVEQGPVATREGLVQAAGGTVPPNMDVLPGSGDRATNEPASTVYYMVRKTAAITGRDLRNARPTLDENNLPAVGFTINQDGARKFSKVTGENIGRQLAIILDGRVVSAPRIDGRISDEGRISGSFTQQEAQDLSLVLRSGALPASLDYLRELTVGPTLGQDSIRSGVMASLVGLSLVVAFMLIYYKLSGVNAIIALSFNLLILLALMTYIGATMTLPGIAGFILTMGMGVDSNVLIFERIKEELSAQRGVRQAVQSGFSRVFLTLLDTHIASLISAAFLFQFGTGPIRGFATTLSIGLISNIFTSTFVSKTIFEMVLSRRRVAALSI
jgi:preprotein translocase subunit SecD